MALGCGDGSVRLFDRRLPPQEARVMTWREHSAWVIGAYFRGSSGGAPRLITGSLSGDIRFFDLRRNSSVNTVQTAQGITAMAVHNVADIFAWYLKSFKKCIEVNREVTYLIDSQRIYEPVHQRVQLVRS